MYKEGRKVCDLLFSFTSCTHLIFERNCYRFSKFVDDMDFAFERETILLTVNFYYKGKGTSYHMIREEGLENIVFNHKRKGLTEERLQLSNRFLLETIAII